MNFQHILIEKKLEIVTSLEQKLDILQEQSFDSLFLKDQLILSQKINHLSKELNFQRKINYGLNKLKNTINETAIDEAYEIFNTDGTIKAREYIKENVTYEQKNKEDNIKQAEVLFFEAKMLLSDKNYSEAEILYEKAILCNKNVENLFEVGYFFQRYKANFTQAIVYYEEALELAKEYPNLHKPNVEMILNNLANLHAKDKTKRVEAEQEYIKALNLGKELSKTDPDTYLPDVEMTLNNLATFHSHDSSKRKETEADYQEALILARQLAKTNPEKYIPNVEMILN